MRIVFLGDSLTWGGYGGDFVAEVAKQLPNHEIINAGIGGNTVVNLLRRVDDVLEQEPDGVFVMVGGNDAISYSQPETRAYYKTVHKIDNGYVPPHQFAQVYRDLLLKIQLDYVQTWVGLEPTEYSNDLVHMLDKYNELACNAARSLNVPVIDLMKHFPPVDMPEHRPMTLKSINQIGIRVGKGWDDYEAERQQYGYSFTFDGLHLTPAAAVPFADVLVEFLQPWL